LSNWISTIAQELKVDSDLKNALDISLDLLGDRNFTVKLVPWIVYHYLKTVNKYEKISEGKYIFNKMRSFDIALVWREFLY